ncbi:MAG: M3 family oligoendopeptidase [Anaerolineae bacterium]
MQERSVAVEEGQFSQRDWSLEALLPAREGEPFEGLLRELEGQVEAFEGKGELLSPEMSRDAFLEMMQLAESITTTTARLIGYARLWFAENTQAQDALAFLGRIEQLGTEIRNRMLFFELWWKGLEQGAAQRLLDVSGDYAYYLETLRRFRPHTLSEPEEKIVNIKDVNGVDALVNLYDMITNRLTFELTVDGELKELTRAELSAYFRDPSAALREAAYRELNEVYGDQATVLGQIYSHRMRDWANENLSLRGFDSAIAVRNLANDIPGPVVDTLLDVCQENVPLFHRYFRFKASQLGLDRLRRYDVYAPLGAADKAYPFPEAADLVLESLRSFSTDLATSAQRVFTEDHLDSEIRHGKRGGAFCAGVLPGVTPWVLVNYVGKIRDVTTLAHELGHAVHAMMAEDHSIFTYHASLPLAETASVFSEMLLTDRLLQEEDDPEVRRRLLGTVLDDAYATVVRQAYFVLFEREAHRQAAEGVTVDQLCALYLHNMEDQFGDAVEVTDDFRWEWTAIPHIYHSPFYCYAYSFGHLLVLALYQQYKEEGRSFVPRFLNVLAYGGSRSPDEIIREAGFDMASPDFWQRGFNALEGWLEELTSL